MVYVMRKSSSFQKLTRRPAPINGCAFVRRRNKGNLLFTNSISSFWFEESNEWAPLAIFASSGVEKSTILQISKIHLQRLES